MLDRVRSPRVTLAIAGRWSSCCKRPYQTQQGIQPLFSNPIHRSYYASPVVGAPSIHRVSSLCTDSRNSNNSHSKNISESRSYIQRSVIRHKSSVLFSGWTPLEWHKDSFLSEASVSEKEEWLKGFLQSGDKRIDVDAFLVVLRALSQSPEASAARRAERWMYRLKDCRCINQHHHPSTVTAYETIIRTWANADKEGPEVIVNRAERWLNEILRLGETHPDNESLRPNIGLFNAYLDACTRGRLGKNKRDQTIVYNHTKKADALLRKLHSAAHHSVDKTTTIIPNTESFNYVLRGWTRCRYDQTIMQRIMSLLRMMEAYQRDDPVGAILRPDTKSYCLVMDGLVRGARVKAQACIETDGRWNADSSLNGLDEIRQVEAILKYMHDLHDGGVEGILPHRVPYNILLTGWSSLAQWNHHDAPFQAEEVLRKMLTHRQSGFKEASPDRISYEKVMMGWANSSQPNAGQRARWWLRKLWNESELEGDKDLLPTVGTYNIVIRALAHSEGASAAESLLLDLGDKYREESDASLCPNSESFALVIRAWLRQARTETYSDDKFQALSRAVEWLSSLREIEGENKLATTPEQYVGVLKAAMECARDRPEVLQMAQDVFDARRRSRHGIDDIAYASLLGVGLEALSFPEDDQRRTDFVHALFDQCREDGLMGKHLVQTLTGSNTYEEGWTIQEREELMKGIFQTWPFPRSWSRNIRSLHYLAKEIHFERSGGFSGPPVTQRNKGLRDDDHDLEDEEY